MEILLQSPDKRIQHSQLGVIHELLKEFCSEEYSISGLGDNPLLDVEIMIDGKTIAIKAYLDTSYDDWKWRKKIQEKRKLADCVVDGYLPTIGSVKPGTLGQEAEVAIREWLDRLNNGEVSTVNRRDLAVELIPVETHKMLLLNDFTEPSERQSQMNVSEFSKLNNIFNNSKSEAIHKRIQEDPQFLEDYHKKLDVQKRHWDFDPVDFIASKIKGLKWPAHIIMNLVVGDFGCGRAVK